MAFNRLYQSICVCVLYLLNYIRNCCLCNLTVIDNKLKRGGYVVGLPNLSVSWSDDSKAKVEMIN